MIYSLFSEFNDDRFARTVFLEPITPEQACHSLITEFMINSDRFFLRSVHSDKHTG